MHTGRLVFAQLTDQIHPEQFRRCVRRYNGDYKVKTFSCWNQFLCMAFGQLTFRESLRDVETCLRSRRDQLYHLGIRGEVSHSTLADANRERDWRIYYDLTTVRVLRRLTAVSSFVYRVLVHERRCERFESFMRFLPSTFIAKLPGCIPENLCSRNSPI